MPSLEFRFKKIDETIIYLLNLPLNDLMSKK